MRINRLKLLIGITAKKIAIHYYPDIIIIQLLERLISLINLGRSWKCLYQVRAIAVFPVFRLLTDFVCLLTYEFWLSLWKIVRCSVILLLPLLNINEFSVSRNWICLQKTKENNFSFHEYFTRCLTRAGEDLN